MDHASQRSHATIKMPFLSSTGIYGIIVIAKLISYYERITMYSRSLVWQSLRFSLKNYFQLLFRFFSRGLIASLLALLVSGICSGAIYGIMKWGFHLSNHVLITGSIILASISAFMAISFFSLASIKGILDFARNEKSPWLILFPATTICNMWLATLFIMIAVLFGSIFLLVPGLYIAYRLLFTQYYIVSGVGASAAIKKSWETTTGASGDIIILSCFILGIIALVATAIVFMPSMVSILQNPILRTIWVVVSFPFQMATAYLYVHMTKK